MSHSGLILPTLDVNLTSRAPQRLDSALDTFVLDVIGLGSFEPDFIISLTSTTWIHPLGRNSQCLGVRVGIYWSQSDKFVPTLIHETF